MVGKLIGLPPPPNAPLSERLKYMIVAYYVVACWVYYDFLARTVDMVKIWRIRMRIVYLKATGQWPWV